MYTFELNGYRGKLIIKAAMYCSKPAMVAVDLRLPWLSPIFTGPPEHPANYPLGANILLGLVGNMPEVGVVDCSVD
jgi:hypothetical protein